MTNARDIVKTLAFVFGLCIVAVGAVGLLAPRSLVWVAGQFVVYGAFAFYALAAVRLCFGLVLIFVAPASRAPRALRVLGFVIVILGIATGLTGLLGIGGAQATIESWSQQGAGVVRLTGIGILALGSFVAYCCAPRRAV